AHRQDIEHRSHEDEGDRGLAGAEGDRRHGFGSEVCAVYRRSVRMHEGSRAVAGMQWTYPARGQGEARGFRCWRQSAWLLPLGEQGARCYTMAGCARYRRVPRCSRGEGACANAVRLDSCATRIRGPRLEPWRASAKPALVLGIEPLQCLRG